MEKGTFGVAVLIFATIGLCTVLEQARATQMAGEIRGRIVAEAGRQALAGGLVGVAYYGPGGLVVDEAFANEEGEFSITGLPTAAVFLVGRARGYGRSVAFALAEPGSVQEVELLLPLGATLSGRVVDSQGESVSDARVELEYLDRLEDRLVEFADLVDRARAQGLRIVTVEPKLPAGSSLTQPGEGKGTGLFAFHDVDPNRAFRLTVWHTTRGQMESSIITLNEEESREDIVLVYGQ